MPYELALAGLLALAATSAADVVKPSAGFRNDKRDEISCCELAS